MSTGDEPLVDTQFDLEDSPNLLDQINDPVERNLPGYLLNIEANRLSVAQSQQELQAIDQIADNVPLLEHQLDAAQ